MGAVHKIASAEAVDRAWEAYAAIARRIVDEPALLVCRPTQEEYARAYERWRRLYMMGCSDYCLERGHAN